MNEIIKQVSDAVILYQKKKAALQLITFVSGGAFGVVMFVLGRLTA